MLLEEDCERRLADRPCGHTQYGLDQCVRISIERPAVDPQERDVGVDMRLLEQRPIQNECEAVAGLRQLLSHGRLRTYILTLRTYMIRPQRPQTTCEASPAPPPSVAPSPRRHGRARG